MNFEIDIDAHRRIDTFTVSRTGEQQRLTIYTGAIAAFDPRRVPRYPSGSTMLTLWLPDSLAYTVVPEVSGSIGLTRTDSYANTSATVGLHAATVGAVADPDDPNLHWLQWRLDVSTGAQLALSYSVFVLADPATTIDW